MDKAVRGKYRITKNADLGQGVFELNIEAPDICRAASAGQFVNIYLPGGDMLLPRPIGIADAQDGILTLVYAVVGKGTKALSSLAEGGILEAMGPLGTGFFDYPGSLLAARKEPPDRRSILMTTGKKSHERRRVLLIGGGAGIAPLYFAAKKLRAAVNGGVMIEAFLGFREQPWYSEKFSGVCDDVWLASETEGAAGFHGNVIGLLDAAYRGAANPGVACPDAEYRDVACPGAAHTDAANLDAVSLALACGPRPMLAAASEWCATHGVPLRVSLEERMGCGYGACAGCTVKTRLIADAAKPQNGPDVPDAEGFIRKKTCVHGPVFWADEVVW